MTATNNKAGPLSASTKGKGNPGTNHLTQDNEVECMAAVNDHRRLQSAGSVPGGPAQWQPFAKPVSSSSPHEERLAEHPYNHQRQEQQNQHQYRTSRQNRFKPTPENIEKQAHNTVFVGNLTKQTSRSDLRYMFSQFGKFIQKLLKSFRLQRS